MGIVTHLYKIDIPVGIGKLGAGPLIPVTVSQVGRMQISQIDNVTGDSSLEVSHSVVHR